MERPELRVKSFMSDSKRQCSTCQFFQIAQLSGNGWCTHPKRQVASDVKILVRERELACRNSWGDDLWADGSSHTTTSDVIPGPRKGLFVTNQRIDDEVTSVVDTTSMQAPIGEPVDSVGTDDVVTFTTVRSDDSAAAREPFRPRPNDLNTPANADQDERVRLMARGSKDAIKQARVRHSQRRKPAEPSGEPGEPAGSPEGDQVLQAQDRDHYQASIRANPNLSGTHGHDAFLATPPVPRSEVPSLNGKLSPASGADARFDSVPEFKPEVDLPRLREFLRAGATEASPARDGKDRPLNSYDLVLKRAHEIRAASDVARDMRLADRNRVHIPEPQPAPPARTDRPDQGVVWDVEGQRLGIAFERARAAINIPASTHHRHVAEPGPQPFESAPLAVEPVDHLLTTRLDDVQFSIQDDDVADDDEVYAESRMDQDSSDQFEAESSWYDDDEDSYLGNPPVESPRGSWWRSLNFGLKRRYRQAPAIEDYVPVELAAGDHVQGVEDDFNPGEDVAAPYEEQEWDDRQYQDADEELIPAAVYVEPFDDEPNVVPAYATTEESWLQDEWEFPEPQPVAWHEQRSQVLAQSPANLVPAPAQVDLSPSGASFDTAAGTYPGHLARNEYRVEPAQRQPAYYAIDQPSGMDALRTALFGNDPGRPLAESSYVSVESHAPSVPAETRRQRYPEDQVVGEEPRRRSPRPERRPPAGIPIFAQHQSPFDTDFDIRDAILDENEDLDQYFEVASNVPKSCSTCRSFRPSEDGSRGWCMNDWATTHRQMVNAGDLACRSSIGDWWLAVDTSWIPPVDVIQPETPRTDRLVAQTDARQESASQGRRRVRTRNVG
jgi:hypothetical protein